MHISSTTNAKDPEDVELRAFEGSWREKERILERVMGLPFTPGNRLEVLKNGCQIFPAMLKAIENATETVDFITFVYWQGEIAEKFARRLAKKAEEGLKVRVLLDSFGSAPISSKYLEVMENAGVEVRWFRPLARLNFINNDNRTHRKILVCDQRAGFTGGVGIASEWEGDARNPGEWRETHCRIEGPAIDGLSGAFWSNWMEAEEYLPQNFAATSEPTPDKGDARVMVVRSSASDFGSDISMMMSCLITLAEERLWITTGYLVLDESFKEQLCQMAARGLDIRIIIPGEHTDKRFDQLASEDDFAEITESGVKVYKYNKTMYHAKVMLIDNWLSLIGSCNFNQRSLKKDEEVALLINHEDTLKTLEEHFREDLLECELIRYEKWEKRGPLQRLGEIVTKPFKKQL